MIRIHAPKEAGLEWRGSEKKAKLKKRKEAKVILSL